MISISQSEINIFADPNQVITHKNNIIINSDYTINSFFTKKS